MAAESIHALRRELERELPGHGTWVRELARSLERDESSAEALAQDAALAALQRRRSLGAALAPWLACVTRNFARRGWRDAARRAAREHVAARSEAVPGADEAAARLEIQRILVAELSALEPRLRLALVRRYFDGWSAARIARETGEPAPTVRWRLQRGLAELRARLDRRGGGDGIQWRLALLPVCGGGAPWLATWPATSSAPWLRLDSLRPLLGLVTIQGALTMKAASQALAAATLLAALGLGAWWQLGNGETPRSAETDTAAPEAPELRAPARIDEPLPAAPSVARESLPASQASAAGSVRESSPAARPADVARLTGRTVDERLVPVRDARIGAVGDEPSARSAPDGSFALDVRPTRWNACTLRVEADGFATRFVESTLEAGEEKDLGEVVLEPGGALRGRVFGPDGAPFEGALVSVTQPDLWGSFEAARVHGPFAAQILSARSGADGRFEIDGVGVGPRRAWAGAPGMRYAVSPPIEVRAHQSTDEVELVLEPARGDDRIRGIVLSPRGEPVGEARLECTERAGGGRTTFGLTADASGTFEIAAKHARVYDLRAFDDADRWSSVEAKGLQPGAQPELRFVEARWIDVSVRASDGTPIDELCVGTTAPGGSDELQRAKATGGTGAREFRVLVPNEAFVVQADARGFQLEREGPFTPENAPDALAIELVPAPGVRGRVLAGDEPVSGARVALHEARSDLRIDHQGYLSLVMPEPTDETRTDEAGRFTLKLRSRGSFVVRAEAEGFAAGDTEALQLAPETGRSGLELVLGKGGDLEGRVRVAPGRDPTGIIVAVNRGDAFPRTVRTDSEGRFGFEGLTPGRWVLARGKAEFNPRGGGSAIGSAETPLVLPFNCTIVEGETTHQDLDLRDFAPCELAGTLRVNGAPVEHWGVQAWPGAAQAIVGELPSTTTRADGSFELTLEDPGTVRLAFSPPAELGGEGRIDVLTELRPGANTWERDLAMGRLTGRCLSAVPGEEIGLFYNTAEGVEPACWLPLEPDESGRYVLPFVPAGRGSVRRLVQDGERATWSTVVETEVLARRERVLDVP